MHTLARTPKATGLLAQKDIKESKERERKIKFLLNFLLNSKRFLTWRDPGRHRRRASASRAGRERSRAPEESAKAFQRAWKMFL